VVVLAVAHPWASASSTSYLLLSSQSLADSRCNLHATSRSTSHSRRSFSCRFKPSSSVASLSPASVCDAAAACRSLALAASPASDSAQLRSPRSVFWPLEFIELSSRKDDSTSEKQCVSVEFFYL